MFSHPIRRQKPQRDHSKTLEIYLLQYIHLGNLFFKLVVTPDSLSKILFARGCLLILAIRRFFSSYCTQFNSYAKEQKPIHNKKGGFCETKDTGSR